MSINGKASKLVFQEGYGLSGRENVNCVLQLDELTPEPRPHTEEGTHGSHKDIDLTELPPGAVANDIPGDDEVTDQPPIRQNAFNRSIEMFQESSWRHGQINCNDLYKQKIDMVDGVIKGAIRSQRKSIKWGLYAILLGLYIGYVIYAIVLDFHRALALFVISMLALAFALFRLLSHFCGDRVARAVIGCRQQKCGLFVKERMLIVKCLLYLLFTGLLITMCALAGVYHSVINEPERLKSLFGLACMLLVGFLLSRQPGMINWRTVYWGLWLQLFLGVLILRTQPGYDVFNWLGANIEAFLSFVNYGADFVFGPAPLENHQILLVVLPVIIFTSSIFALLYYWGFMQIMIQALAILMQHTMGISGAESFATASNIFVGMTVAPLAIKPYLNDMTESEMHAVIVGGFATIAGSVLAIFISFGINASHLLAASFMSAPAALVTAKMFLPETKTPKTASISNIRTAKAQENNALEAMYVGAIDGLKICAYVIGNIVAIVSVLAFVNAALLWLGSLVNIENLSFQLICRYVLYPVAWLLGTDSGDSSFMVAELIGVKLFLNEIIAYDQLSAYVERGEVTPRTEVIATYALCGFANLGSIGIMMGGLIPLVPHRKSEISRLCVKALLASCVALFMTACVAGLLYDETKMHIPIGGDGPNATTVATT